MSVESFLDGKANLKEKLSNCNNVGTFRGIALDLQSQLNQISKELAPHDLQKYSKELDELLRDINTRTPPQVVKLQFKKKPKLRLFQNKSKEAVNDRNTSQSQMVSDQDFNVVQATTTYENLQRCSIIGTHLIDDTGSLSFKGLKLCTINLYEPIFRQGSITLVNCYDCSIYIHTGKETQLRLHDLKGCKLMIRPSQAPQRIVMERCRECTFHEVCKPWITIQEFDNLALTQEKPRNYAFKPLEDWW